MPWLGGNVAGHEHGPAAATPVPVLQLRGIVKRFPGVVANDRIDLDLHAGEILALLGENGAGKTTLMNILYGLLRPDAGRIAVDGRVVGPFNSPADAIALGIGMVHQHFMLVPVMTVTENVMLGLEPVRWGGLLDPEPVARRIAAISERYRFGVDPAARVEELPVGVQQRVEIIKLLYRNARIVVLDEPTAVLTPQEVDELFAILRQLAQSGHSVILITHKLREALTIADRIVVLRAGRVVGSAVPRDTSEAALAAMMVGRGVTLEVARPPVPEQAPPVLSARDLWVLNDRGLPAVAGVSFAVRAGEVLGVAGVQGNGQTELMEALAGLRPPAQGHLVLDGVDITHEPVRRRADLGVAYVPEDRQRDGLVTSFSVLENLMLNAYRRPPVLNRWRVDWTQARRYAAELLERFDIRAPGLDVAVRTLSGGNQQKVIVAREFTRPLRVLLAAQPTRGLDVGSVAYIHGQLLAKRAEGVAVVLASTELDEILALSDRIAVMYRGRFVAQLAAAEAARERLGLLMAGVAA